MKKRIWECKIGEIDDSKLEDGADLPMRLAIQRAYKEITGEDCLFCFSGWGGTLTESEEKYVQKKRSDYLT